MDLSSREDHRGGLELEAAGASATQPSHGFISFPPFPSAPCPTSSNCEQGDAGDRRERRRCPAAAVDDDSPVKKIKKRPSRSWKRVNLKRDNLTDRILELHKLVSPLGKKDIASVIHEARSCILIQHEQLKALTTACMQPLQPSALQESEEMDTLTSRGLCLFPIDALPIDMLILLRSL